MYNPQRVGNIVTKDVVLEIFKISQSLQFKSYSNKKTSILWNCKSTLQNMILLPIINNNFSSRLKTQ